MPKNTESLNRSLFDLLHSKGFDPTMLDTSGKEIPTPEEAEVFQFNFIKDGEDYGKVTISIDGLHKLCVYFSDDVADSEKEESHGEDESWYKVLNQLKRFSQKYQLSFELKNIDHLKHDMAKREYMKKQEKISEGYYPMGKKASYNDAVPNVKIVIQHTRQIEEGEQRYRNIAKIFLENSEGERFLAPTIKPGVARVYGRLIAEGDKPHGERWNHVTSLVEEYQKMGAFVRATRNGQFNESAQRLVNEGINHYQGLRETLSRMTGHRGYNTYFESWTPSLMEDETEETNLNELFVQETLDPRIESVMPILNKLQKKVAEMKEVNELSEWADSLTEAPGAETLGHNVRTDTKNLKAFDLEETHPAVRQLKNKLGQVAKQNPGSGLGRHYDNIKNGMTYKDLVRKGMVDQNGKIDIPGFKDDEYIDESEDEEHNPVASAITRRIINQRIDLLKKYGPVAINQAIDDVVDFVGDVEEIGSSDVSGWIKQVERKLGGVDEGMFDKVKDVGKKVFDKLGGGNEEDLIKKLQKDAGITPTGKKPEFDVKAKELARSNPSDPGGNFMKGGKDLGIFKEEDMDEARVFGYDIKRVPDLKVSHDDAQELKNQLGMLRKVLMYATPEDMSSDARKQVSDIQYKIVNILHKNGLQESDLMNMDEGMFDKVKDAVKKVGGKVLDKLGHGSDEELLKKIQKDVGAPAGSQHGKPSMAKPNDDSDIIEDDIDESALQASFGIKKYGKKGMDKLRAAGQKHASEKTMQNIRAEYSDKEKPVSEGQDDLDTIRRLLKK